MKKFIAGASLLALVAFASPALAAFEPQVGGGKTIATGNALVVRDLNGMRVYEVSSNPQSVEEWKIYAAHLERQLQDVAIEAGQITKPACVVEWEKYEAERVSGFSERMSALASRVKAFVAR